MWNVLQLVSYKKNPFLWTGEAQSLTSSISKLEFTNSNGSELQVKSLKKPIDIFLPQMDEKSIVQTHVLLMKNMTMSLGLEYEASDPDSAVTFDISLRKNPILGNNWKEFWSVCFGMLQKEVLYIFFGINSLVCIVIW